MTLIDFQSMYPSIAYILQFIPFLILKFRTLTVSSLAPQLYVRARSYGRRGGYRRRRLLMRKFLTQMCNATLRYVFILTMSSVKGYNKEIVISIDFLSATLHIMINNNRAATSSCIQRSRIYVVMVLVPNPVVAALLLPLSMYLFLVFTPVVVPEPRLVRPGPLAP